MRLLALAAALPRLVWGCSYVEIPFPGVNGTSYMIARSMELGDLAGQTDYAIEVVPPTAKGEVFGYVAAMSIFHLSLLEVKVPGEGMNERGLTMSAQTLAESVYEEEEEGVPSVKVEDLIHETLSRCDSVDSALAFLDSVRVVVSPLSRLMGQHWAIADAAGRSVVVEYLQGKRLVHENTPRVMTNDPPLDWHWRNLNTYTSLSPKYPTQNSFLEVETGSDVGSVPRTVGHGWNLHGLPGDSSSPSRFVRLFYLRGYALHAKKASDESDAIVLGTALLNNVIIPYGTVAPDPAKPSLDRPEYTPYAVLKAPAEKKMLIRAYRNQRWRQIDLSRLDFTIAQRWPMEDGTLGIDDITGGGQPLGEGPSGEALGETVV